MIGLDEDAEVADLDVPRLRVALRIRGDSLDPDFLTQQLGVAPSFGTRKGEVIARRGREQLHTTGVWTYRVEVQSGTELGDAIAHLLAALPEDATLWEEITSSFSADLLCAVSLEDDHQRTVVDPEVLSALSRRGLALSLELYRR